jgi:uncharacterized protein YkwD
MSRRFVPLAALVLCACGGASSSGALEGRAPTITVDAPAPGLERYATRSTPEPVVGESQAVAGVERGIRRAAEEAGTELSGDGRLALLAAWTAEHLGEGGTPPPHEVMEFFSQHLGIVEPTPHLIILGQPDPEMLEAGIADSVGQRLARQRYTHFGAAVIPRQGLTLAIVTLSTRNLEIESVPREIRPGATLRLTGRLVGAFSNPVIAVTGPDGSTSRQTGGQGPRFELPVATTGSGVYRVELLAEGPRGDTVIANFPLYAGTEAPMSVTLTTGAEGESGAPSDVAQALFALLNDSRSDVGAGPLVREEQLDEISVAHSRDMVDNEFVGHESPSTGGAPDRVRRAGLESGLILENIGRGYSATEIHRGLMASPGHRANILNPDVTHVGVGVVVEEEGDRRAFVATELFVRMNREVDLSNAPEQLLAIINENRRRRGADPVELDPNLQRAAQRGAEHYFGEPDLTQQDVVDEASASLRRFAIAFSRVGGLMAVVDQIEEAGQLEPTFDGDLRYVGIGVAQGSRPDVPSNSIAVVIMLAWPR